MQQQVRKLAMNAVNFPQSLEPSCNTWVVAMGNPAGTAQPFAMGTEAPNRLVSGLNHGGKPHNLALHGRCWHCSGKYQHSSRRHPPPQRLCLHLLASDWSCVERCTCSAPCEPETACFKDAACGPSFTMLNTRVHSSILDTHESN